ncbi:NAD-dependent protein deacylase [Capsulimonas corticalis]|uniref:NAD-dependent protein deacylase n=1 Tax=Capsulimonas corticalis TaxID=2219043 RepID=A0A402CWU0_9BACT|nr:NAD-dependent deacylase [Capsulimonas corticalis]BDI34286.1 NAD-dependent protein deacylase [Capsulimonas corticalis]
MNTQIPAVLTKALRSANHIAVLTGAGVSAASGLPTFREAQTGLWAQYRPEDLATAQAFRKNPKLVWEWYDWRRSLVAKAEPNAAHIALAEMARRVSKFTLITQNVDGLHQQAGSVDVLELHGNIGRTKCFHENVVIESWLETDEVPPLCPRCGGPLRPDVVWFGESLPKHAIDAAGQAAINCDLFLSVGTSGMVEPAASLLRVAAEHGALGVVINPTRIHAPAGVIQIEADAGEALTALLDQRWPQG